MGTIETELWNKRGVHEKLVNERRAVHFVMVGETGMRGLAPDLNSWTSCFIHPGLSVLSEKMPLASQETAVRLQEL